MKENNYYTFGLQHQGYNDIANSCRNEEAEAYKYNGKEYEDNFGLNMYEYGARNYDPAVGRFFNIDNYAEKFSNMTPYQYAGNTPTYFIDKNGDYIYVWDEGKRDYLKFENGKLYEQDKNGGYTIETTATSGSFAEVVYQNLMQIYNFTTNAGGGSGGNGRWFLNLFNNNQYNVNIHRSDYGENGYRHGEINLSGIFPNFFTTENKFQGTDFFIPLTHELAHAFSAQLSFNNFRHEVWVDNIPGNNPQAHFDEIFAVFIENMIRSEHNIPLRTHYGTESIQKSSPEKFEELRILEQNENNNFQLTPKANEILNNYKKSLPLNGIEWKNY
ncbi:RHS repeat-associated core domain-containing protein [Paenimyroides ummariense]|uniref:RHS repeat-associated core domain-containing protein n=1 Tax=Paenimyroides ummariense TaxID=913024 RepID=A0A1I5GVN1_9FLAO|nr:RHS repeat-associated core domain-containing protein [Paenimyroides ummariense]SFO40007.1 RHS repeat-associated core domain-containing protein [Paenimyroides ummariense]